MLAIAIVCTIGAGTSSFSAIRAEATGVASYSTGPRGVFKERVTKFASLAKFRDAVNRAWLSFVAMGLVATVAFLFYRALSD